MGVFLCYHMKWYATDLGITVIARAYDEKYRTKYTGGGFTEEVKGRGLIWDNPKVYPNFYLRLGAESIPHFTLDIFRGDYDARYGIIQTKLIIPIHSLFTMKVGGYLYKTNAFFLEPTVNWEGISVGFKFGSIMNYRNKHIERTGIVDSFFYAGSVAYQW
ncbi:MAG: hypothetical protein CVV44_03360 [Spirochaetae bacterium HGW-Spirochaetae-1]|nr:MAG: hypothetical protein CVV44_03360 [Spirochaetae bacterium HGW-Spirochaetae-1]